MKVQGTLGGGRGGFPDVGIGVSHFKVLLQSFHVRGSALSGGLSCMRAGLLNTNLYFS